MHCCVDAARLGVVHWRAHDAATGWRREVMMLLRRWPCLLQQWLVASGCTATGGGTSAQCCADAGPPSTGSSAFRGSSQCRP